LELHVDDKLNLIEMNELELYFFLQAEDAIRDYKVTGVQTCALPISLAGRGGGAQTCRPAAGPRRGARTTARPARPPERRTSCPRDRERVVEGEGVVFGGLDVRINEILI